MLAVAVCFVTLAIAFDLKTDRIPNALNLTGLTAGLLTAFMRAGPNGLFVNIGATLLMFATGFVLYLLHAIRGGDGKMLCVMAAMYGNFGGFYILFLSLLIGSVMGLPRFVKRKKGERTGIHYSIPIALGMIWYLVYNGGGR